MPDLAAARKALIAAARALGFKSIDDPRNEWERRLQKVLKRTLNGQYEAVIAQLGDPPNLNKLDAHFWNGLDNVLRADLQKELQSIYVDAGKELAAQHSIDFIDWTLVNEQAADWARTYSFERVTQLSDTSQAALQKQVPAFFETEGATIGDLKDALFPTFGAARAETIAVTEVTRAVSRGERGTVDEIGRGGIVMEPEWLTMEDGIVDDVCRRLDGQVAVRGVFTDPRTGETFVEPPDPHPECRCRLRWRMVA